MVNANERPFSTFRPRNVFGVDFSGARLAGKNAWIAELNVIGDPGQTTSPPLKLNDLRPLGRAAGDDERDVVCRFLADSILASHDALWGMDFPFGLPIELGLDDWPSQLEHVRSHDGDAKSYGRDLVKTAQLVGNAMHIRRLTDSETKTPFDCYHYRIIYQTFHGMRDVLARVAGQDATAVMPFEAHAWRAKSPVRRVVVEACPSSTLKRWSLPHQNYKQPGDQPPDAVRRRTRRAILKVLSSSVEISDHRWRVMMNNPGGDAIDAVLAGVGAWQSWYRDDHSAIANHERYPIEGRVYC
ncbi:DUF429 domain-containing protein [Neorhodopirellula pilleata]|uniref:DUF429 domain-containing protein n=1 Tax=Neorhodopirellula pilleata TaxID=2714738 RepID=A0A5C6AXE2_9BACT|nr:DUF429 domain-containing protein [Neorhodopirellula pilleata]TWU03736.1 hypothetical protein Pla100_06660 [Neorhodopirellula pilleata]